MALTSASPPIAQHRRGFWRRQFAAEPTVRQVGFDLVGGFLMPAVCIALDPVVFSDLGAFAGAGSVFGPFTLFARGFIGIELVVFLAWMGARRRLSALAPFLAGALAAGAAFAALVGTLLLPLSLFGMLLLGLGFLGLVPFLTSFSFARAAVHAYRAANFRSVPLRRAAVLIGAAIVLAVPAASVVRARADVAHAIAAAEDGADAGRGLEHLRYLAWLAPVELEPVLDAFERATGDSQRRLGRLYEGLMGIDPEAAIARR